MIKNGYIYPELSQTATPITRLGTAIRRTNRKSSRINELLARAEREKRPLTFREERLHRQLCREYQDNLTRAQQLLLLDVSTSLADLELQS